MGAISPGTVGGIDTLTIDGSAVLSSGSTLMIDVGPDNTSDLLAITGEASLGGVVAVGAGVLEPGVGLGQEFTILTADGGLSGTFNAGDLSAILYQNFTYTDTAVLMEILARSYGSVVDRNDAVQRGYAQLLDQNRGNAALAALYNVLDFADQSAIQSLSLIHI